MSLGRFCLNHFATGRIDQQTAFQYSTIALWLRSRVIDFQHSSSHACVNHGTHFKSPKIKPFSHLVLALIIGGSCRSFANPHSTPSCEIIQERLSRSPGWCQHGTHDHIFSGGWSKDLRAKEFFCSKIEGGGGNGDFSRPPQIRK